LPARPDRKAIPCPTSNASAAAPPPDLRALASSTPGRSTPTARRPNWRTGPRAPRGGLTANGAFVAYTGNRTGRSRKTVTSSASRRARRRSPGQRQPPARPGGFDRLLAKMTALPQAKPLFLTTPTPAPTQTPAQRPRRRREAGHVVRALPVPAPQRSELTGFRPDWTISPPPTCTPTRPRTAPAPRHLSSSTSPAPDLIGGTHYAGEIKKSVFSVLNYLLPARGVFPMHCSANIGAGRHALFFGCPARQDDASADPDRRLIGDDDTAGRTRACSTSRAAATPRRSGCRRRRAADLGRDPLRVGAGKRRRGPDEPRPGYDADRLTENTPPLSGGFHPAASCPARRAPDEHFLPDLRRLRRVAAAGPADAEQAMYHS